MRLEYAFYDTAKNTTIQNIKLNKMQKFSLTLDEWSSHKNVRYINVNLHSLNGQVYNLGLSRIDGSCPAEVALQLVMEKLD